MASPGKPRFLHTPSGPKHGMERTEEQSTERHQARKSEQQTFVLPARVLAQLAQPCRDNISCFPIKFGGVLNNVRGLFWKACTCRCEELTRFMHGPLTCAIFEVPWVAQTLRSIARLKFLHEHRTNDKSRHGRSNKEIRTRELQLLSCA